MCIRPLACELHWLNVIKKKKFYRSLPHVFEDDQGLAQLRTSHQLHCLEPAVFHTRLNDSHVPPVPITQRSLLHQQLSRTIAPTPRSFLRSSMLDHLIWTVLFFFSDSKKTPTSYL